MMEDAFKKLKKEGKNSVENLVKWLQDANVIEKEKEAENKAQNLFEAAKDKANIEFGHFKDAISKLAGEQKKPKEELNTSLSEQAPKFLEALKAAATAFKDTIDKK